MVVEQLTPRPGEHAVVVGMNGMGKTYYENKIVAFRPYVLVLDTKGLIRWPGYKRFTTLKKFVAARDVRKIYAPNRYEERDPQYWNAFFEYAYQSSSGGNIDDPRARYGAWTVVVDEVMGCTYKQEIPPAYRACLTRGRQFGMCMISGTQQPKNVPVTIFAESKHTTCFYLQMEDHRKRVAEWMPIETEAIAKLPERFFYYYRMGERVAHGPLKLGRHDDVRASKEAGKSQAAA